MKHARKTKRKFFSQTLALVLALTIMMSTVIVSGLSLTVFAASSISGAIYLDVSGNSDWQGKTVVASFDNGVTQTARFSASGNMLSVTVPSQASNANRMTLTAYPSDYPFDLASSVPTGKYRIITKQDRSRNYCYAWNSVSNSKNAEWPGQPMTSSGNYYYIDLDQKFEKCIFNANTDQNKTGDLTVRYIGNVAYYNAASFADSLTASVNISSLSSTQNLFVMNSNNSVSVSKYHYNGTSIDATTKTVYLYNPSWSTAYITYDLNDVYQTTVAMISQTNIETKVKYFRCDVPVGATIRFQSRQSSSAGGSGSLSIPSNDSPLYIMESQNYWTTFDELPTDSTRIPNTFGNNSNIYGVTATYFDYLSDGELSNGYLSPNNDGDWYPFQEFNKKLSTYYENNNVKTPLYIGNFNANSTGEYGGFKPWGFKNIPNNSAGLKGYWYAVQGLTSDYLSNNRLVTYTNTSNQHAVMPLFDESFLTDNKVNGRSIGNVFKSYFPFKYTKVGSGQNEVTTYSFDSSGGATRNSSGVVSGANRGNSDNVYFTWNGTTPTAVNYGKGNNYAVNDGSSAFSLTDGTGFGIFPFNNTSSTKGGRGGNDKIDFGFGVQLDMDFRVTESGKLPNGEDIKFKYSGDDDLWVYITDDEGNSELVLDIGGDHKFSSGEINFNTMQSTVDFVDTDYNDSDREKYPVPDDEVWIKQGSGSYTSFYLKTWNKGYDKWIDPYTVSEGFVKFKKSDLEGAAEYTINDNTKAEKCYIGDANSTFGNAYQIVYRDGANKAELYYKDGGSVTLPGSVTETFNNGVKLSANKTYHMTVFYMERGLIESNFQVSFTMTPVTNNLLVDKEVQIPKINNTSIRNAIYDNDTFGYTSSNASESTMSGKAYTYTDRSGNSTAMTIDGNGSFALKDSESAYFVSQFDTGSDMTVNETTVNDKNILSDRYDTSWILYDGGNQIKSGTSTSANFKLEGEDKDKNADLELAYTNKLKTGDLKITKSVRDKDGNKLDNIDVDFTYTVLLDLNGGTNYEAYPLNYTVDTNGVKNSYYTSDGTISFSPKSTVLINDLPAGTTFKISEAVPEGYTCSNNDQTGTISSTGTATNSSTGTATISSTGTATVSFTNVQSEGEGELTVNKKLDDSNYTGSQFSFTLQGLASAGEGYIDASDITATADSVSNGEVTFKIKFSEVGKYRFKVTEDALDSSLIGYNLDNSTYYIEIAVKANSTTNVLEISKTETKYYSDDSFTTAIDNVTFKNTTEKAKIVVNKSNPSGTSSGTDGTEFAVIRVSKADGITNADVEKIMSDNNLKSAVVAKNGSTKDGTVEFDDLPIYQAGGKMYNPDNDTVINSDNYLTGTSTTQIYCVVEYKATSGFNLNSTPYYVTFPVKAGDKQLADDYYEDDDGYVRDKSTDAYVFTQTFDYTNYPIAMPEASGDGMNGWIKLGLMIIAGAGVLTALYFGYNRINRKRRMARFEVHRK